MHTCGALKFLHFQDQSLVAQREGELMASGAPNALPDRNGAIERQTYELQDDSAAL